MLKFEIRRYEDFTQEELKQFGFENPNWGYNGNDSASYLVVIENGNIIYMMNDDIAPEDVSFHRDLNILDLLNMVYKKGWQKRLKRKSIDDAVNVLSEDIKPGITTEEATRNLNTLLKDLDIKESEDERS